MKKTLVLVAVVVGVHCVVITSLFLIQGCKTTKGTTAPSTSQTPAMPPLSAPSVAPEKTEAIHPSVAGKEGQTEETTEYIVKSGDSLGLIAKRHNISKSELIASNKLTDPNKIRVGQKLVIPKGAYAAVSPAAKTGEMKAEAKHKAKKSAAATPFTSNANEYVVQAGDSLSKICSKLNVKIAELREVNKLVNDKLKVGQKLLIPGKKAEGASEAAPAPAAAEAPAATTPSPAPTATNAVSKPAGSGITHVVMPNEDLISIAKLYAVTVDDIAAANQLGTNRTVQSGQKIIIP